jgi:hypothetical protein
VLAYVCNVCIDLVSTNQGMYVRTKNVAETQAPRSKFRHECWPSYLFYAVWISSLLLSDPAASAPLLHSARRSNFFEKVRVPSSHRDLECAFSPKMSSIRGSQSKLVGAHPNLCSIQHACAVLSSPWLPIIAIYSVSFLLTLSITSTELRKQ